MVLPIFQHFSSNITAFRAAGDRKDIAVYG